MPVRWRSGRLWRVRELQERPAPFFSFLYLLLLNVYRLSTCRPSESLFRCCFARLCYCVARFPRRPRRTRSTSIPIRRALPTLSITAARWASGSGERTRLAILWETILHRFRATRWLPEFVLRPAGEICLLYTSPSPRDRQK